MDYKIWCRMCQNTRLNLRSSCSAYSCNIIKIWLASAFTVAAMRSLSSKHILSLSLDACIVMPCNLHMHCINSSFSFFFKALPSKYSLLLKVRWHDMDTGMRHNRDGGILPKFAPMSL
eukprot:220817_1